MCCAALIAFLGFLFLHNDQMTASFKARTKPFADDSPQNLHLPNLAFSHESIAKRRVDPGQEEPTPCQQFLPCTTGNMEFDPLSRDSAPPRYELESGSEDDDVDVKELGPRPAVEIRGAGSLSTGSEVVVLIQHAGLACLDKSSIPTEHSAIYVGETQQASIAETSQSQTIVYVSSTSQHVPQSRYYELAQAVLDHLAPSSLVVVDSYSPASNVFRSDSDGLSGRLRYLADSTWPQSRIDPSLMVPLSSPESVSGLGAAFITGVSNFAKSSAADRNSNASSILGCHERHSCSSSFGARCTASRPHSIVRLC